MKMSEIKWLRYFSRSNSFEPLLNDSKASVFSRRVFHAFPKRLLPARLRVRLQAADTHPGSLILGLPGSTPTGVGGNVLDNSPNSFSSPKWPFGGLWAETSRAGPCPTQQSLGNNSHVPTRFSHHCSPITGVPAQALTAASHLSSRRVAVIGHMRFQRY